MPLKVHHNLSFYKKIIDQIGEALIVTDLDENIIFVNYQTERLFGYTRKELMGKKPSIFNALPTERKFQVQKEIMEVVSKGGTYRNIIPNKKKDGTVFLIELNIYPFEDEEGNIIAYIGIHRDVTKEHMTETELWKSEEEYKTIFQTSSSLITMVDSTGRIVDCNDRIKDVTGYHKEEVVGKHFSFLIHQDSIAKAEKTLDTLTQDPGASFNREYVMTKKNGEKMIVSINSSAVTDREGRFKHTICFLTDVTEQKNTELILREAAEELRKSNAELEQFAYIASHDLQEPLRVVSSYCQLVRDKCITMKRMDDESARYFEYIIDATDRMKTLIKELLDFSRVGRKEEPIEQIDLNKLIEGLLQDFSIRLEETKGEVIIHEPLPTINGVKVRIRQLFYNLISNALKFKSDEPPKVWIGFCEEVPYWVFYIKDNGVGIPTEHYERIFGVFKRLYSRDQYPGTGIGLALCK